MRPDRVPEEIWMEVCNIVLQAVIKNIPKKNAKKAKWLFQETLQIAEKRSEGKGDKERYTYLNAELQKITRRNKTFLSE